MKLSKIITIADKAYPVGKVQEAFKALEKWNRESKDLSEGQSIELPLVGDGLAEFITRELTDTYDASVSSLAQIQEAHRVMSRAHRELYDVDRAFLNWSPLPKRRKK